MDGCVEYFFEINLKSHIDEVEDETEVENIIVDKYIIIQMGTTNYFSFLYGEKRTHLEIGKSILFFISSPHPFSLYYQPVKTENYASLCPY